MAFLSSIRVVLFFCVVANLVPALAHGQVEAGQKPPESPAEKSDSKKEIATVEIAVRPIAVYMSFDGVFESTKTKEVKAEFENWSDLKIEDVVPEGAAVTNGQDLIYFETTSIEKAIKEAEFAVRNSEFKLESARLDLKQVEETFALDKALAERAWGNAQKDYEYYKSVELPARLDDLDYSEKSAGYFLEYSKDELDQLEQMYTEDELTEESEEIVLKRARRSVEGATRSKERTLRRVTRDRETNVPRDKLDREENLKRSELNYQRSLVTLPISKQKTEIALAQAEFDHINKVKKLEELRQDYEKMNLKSPSDGIVYYGKCVRGKWLGGSGSAKRRLEADKKVVANSIVMTIVDVGQVMVRADVDQSAVGSLSNGARGKARIKSSGAVVAATIKSLSRIPLDNGKYDCQVLVDSLPTNGSVLPGMSCKLSFLVYENKQAIMAPKASVFSDDGGVSHFVYLVDGDKSTIKPVSAGRTSGDYIEILDGLSNGDKIAKSRQ